MSARRSTRPRPPDDLSEDALVAFHWACDELEARGRLSPGAMPTVVMYAQAWSVYMAVSREVAKKNAVIRHKNKVRGVSPDWRVMKEQSRLIRGFLADLGLTPAAAPGVGSGRAMAEEPLEI